MHGGFVPLDLFFRSVRWRHASNNIRRCSYYEILFLHCFLWSHYLRVEKLLRRFRQNGCSFAKRQSYKRHTYCWDTDWLAAFAWLVPASLPLSGWRGQSWQPDGACFWVIASAGLPGNCSWSIQTHLPNSAVSHTSGSLWGISRRQWAACSNALTWRWWSLDGSLLVGACRNGHSQKKKFLFS